MLFCIELVSITLISLSNLAINCCKWVFLSLLSLATPWFHCCSYSLNLENPNFLRKFLNAASSISFISYCNSLRWEEMLSISSSTYFFCLSTCSCCFCSSLLFSVFSLAFLSCSVIFSLMLSTSDSALASSLCRSLAVRSSLSEARRAAKSLSRL